MIGKIARYGEFPPVQRRVAKTINSVLRHNLQRDKIASRAAYNYLCIGDAHRELHLVYIELIFPTIKNLSILNLSDKDR